MKSRRSGSRCDSPMSSECPPTRKKRWHLLCWRMKHCIGGRPTCLRRRERSGRRFWGRLPCRRTQTRPGSESRSFAPLRMTVLKGSLGFLLLALLSCSHPADPKTLVMIIESSPTNLDPRVGLDAQSERIGELIFDALLTRDEHLNVQPGLAERWEMPDPLTYVFHLHHGVTFHDGRPLTSRDVKWTLDSLLQGKIRSTKTATYRSVDRIETPDDFTVIFHLKEA